MSYPWLPLEIYAHILKLLEPSSDSDVSVKTLVRCSEANSTLRNAAILPSLWEPHYRLRYSNSDPEHEESRKQKYHANWRLMYAERSRLDARALDILQSMMAEPRGRLLLARDVAHGLSFDVWHALELLTRGPIPRCFLDESAQHEQDVNKPIPPHAITRKFWAKAMLGVIARRNAIRTWGRLHQPGHDVTFEEALSGLSAFFCVSPYQISHQLDELASQCRAYLSNGKFPIDTSVHDDVVSVSVRICEFLRSLGFRAAESSRFHNLFNHFPHRVLSTNKQTLPMSLVWLFVAIAKRLGLQASPVDFPGRVLAHVAVTNPDQEDVLLDVYGSEVRAVLSASEDIPRMLSVAGFHQLQVSPRSIPTGPSPAGPMLLRAARNIVGSFHIMTQAEFDEISQTDYESASYAALCADLVMTNNGRALTHLVDPDWPTRLDVAPVLLDSVAPLLSTMNRSLLERRCRELLNDDEIPRGPSLYHESAKGVKYFVGLFFTHVAYAYVGCVVGWEPTCMATEEWIVRMGVDNLSGGRHQPFYKVITLTGSPRYVAEQNIVPMDPTPPDLPSRFYNKHQTVGMFFHDADVMEGRRGRMLLSQEMLSQYPEDDAVGQRWVETGDLYLL